VFRSSARRESGKKKCSRPKLSRSLRHTCTGRTTACKCGTAW
jgi:hypothetical protein